MPKRYKERHFPGRKKERRIRGIQQLIHMGKAQFRIPENLDRYSLEDFLAAERMYLKECIILGKCSQ